MSSHGSVRILVVDDHPLFRKGMKQLIEGAGFVVSGEAGSVPEALEVLARCTVELVITDMRLGDLDGSHLIREIKKASPHLAVVVVSMYADRETVLSAVQAGASAYVPKSSGRDEVLAAVRAVLKGRSYLHPEITGLVLDCVRRGRPAPEGSIGLTSREIEVLQMLAAGWTPLQIGEKLFLSLSTVKTHMRGLFRKLEVGNRSELLFKAFRVGLLRRGSGGGEDAKEPPAEAEGSS